MPLELRPPWCLRDDSVSSSLRLGEWTRDGRPALEMDGDDWRPGEPLTLTRTIELASDMMSVRKQFHAVAGQIIGVSARWSCRSTAMAGVHVGGPVPVTLADTTLLTLEIPATVAGSIEIETCLLSSWAHDTLPDGASPDGALMWSDSWNLPPGVRTVWLEGDETRIPVRTISFASRFDKPSSALWAIDLDATIELDALVSNVVTVLLNDEVMKRDFRTPDGQPDAGSLPGWAVAGIQVDLVGCLTAATMDELREADDFSGEGSVGALLAIHLTRAFGSIAGAIGCWESDQPSFRRALWDLFAPDSWEVR